MIGLPNGEVFLLLKDGTKESIELVDLANPKKEMLESTHILKWVKKIGYDNISAIVYERYGKQIAITMAEYYSEHGQDLC
jgi:hypothetical protein